MGYARLAVTSNGTVLTTSVLHDIVGCVTGRFSSSAQLQGAIPAASEIINTLGENWTIVHPSGSFVPSTPNSNIASWVLTSPCVDPAKTKYVRLTNQYRAYTANTNAINQTGTGVSNRYDNNRNLGDGATGTCGIIMQACTSASNASTLINPTWYNTNSAGGQLYPGSNLTGDVIIVSWSARHIMMWSNWWYIYQNIYPVYGYLEYPETDVTIAQSIVPAALIIEMNSANLNAGITTYGPASLNNANYGDIQLPDFYNPTLTSRGTATFSLLSSFDKTINGLSIIKPSSTIPTLDSSGRNTRLLSPLIINALANGVPTMDLSKLTNVYVAANGLGNGGNILSGSTGEYVYLPSTSGIAFAVRRA